MKIIDGWRYNEKSIKAENSGDIDGAKKILRAAVNKGVDTKYSYNRLAVLLRKEGKLKEAIEVQEKHVKIMKKLASDSPKDSWNRKNVDIVIGPILKEIDKMKVKLKKNN